MRMLTNAKDLATQPPTSSSRLNKMLKVDWLGQTLASLAWVVSVFSYGISEVGDWLQRVAACSWFLANIAAVTGEGRAQGSD